MPTRNDGAGDGLITPKPPVDNAVRARRDRHRPRAVRRLARHVADTTLAAGDRLVLYSDGVTGALATDGSEFGEARLAGALRRASGSAAAIADQVIADVLAFGGGADQYDDLTLIVAIGA